MIYRVEVKPKHGGEDARGRELRRQIGLLGIDGVTEVRVSNIYFLQGASLREETAQRIADELLADPVVEDAEVLAWPNGAHGGVASAGAHTVEVVLLPGVTDSVAESLLEGARMIGAQGLEQAATGQRYVIRGDVTVEEVGRIARQLLANEVIQTYSIDEPVSPPFMPVQAANDTVEVIPITEADDAGLEAISRERRLSLDLAEMRAIQTYYRSVGREPTDVELEMLAQTWSEHCVHKTFKALIEYEEITPDGRTQRQIDSILKTFIRAATAKVNKPWVRSAFVDNAGIVAFDERFDLAFKVETHNHPSALEPFGGANTGVGGVIRDVIGVSARPIANTDVLCFGPQDLPFDELPAGVLHPRRIADGVIAGIEDYGNKMGIPTVNGAILFDPGYIANPLVFCGCLGILPTGAHRADPQPGDLIVVIGGRTGRDGLRGATFSSMEMDHETGEIAGSAVQIGHPIHEKQVLEAVMRARDEGLYSAITDCGAGGLSSAIGEMGAVLGAEVHLDRAPLKYAGLRPWEIWLSEAQERMVLAVPPDRWPRLQEICRSQDVEATALGHFTGDGILTLYYGDRIVGQLSMAFLHGGIPRRRLKAVWHAPRPEPESLPEDGFSAETLMRLLASPDIRSKEDVVRRYDHEVQAGTIVKPFAGRSGSGPMDAAVLVPLETWNGFDASRGPQGVALSVGINPSYGAIDPYAMAWAVVDEAIRNAVAVGADPDRIALLDNFCWGNPALPDRLGGLVRCAAGCYDAAVAYEAPFISGKDSLNNEYTGADGQKHAIPGTLLISALGIVPDVRHTVTSDLKRPGDVLYVLGWTGRELGGSAFHRVLGCRGGQVPQPALEAPQIYRRLHQAIRSGWVRACHDVSEGGLAVALAEMAIAGGMGAELRLADVPRRDDVDRDDVAAFSESLGRLLVEVSPEDAEPFEALFDGLPIARAGVVRSDGRLILVGLSGSAVLEADVQDLEHAWRE